MSSKILYVLVISTLWGIIAQNSYAQILNDITKIKIVKGKKIIERDIKIQINAKESNWLSEVKVAHKPSEDFSLIQGKIMDSTGEVVRKLRKRDIKTKSKLTYAAFYVDDVVEEFELYWNKYPYTIEYAYRLVIEEFVHVAYWQPMVRSNTTTLNSCLQVEIPIDYEVNLDASSEFQLEESIVDNKKILKWSIDKFEPRKTEIYAPPMEELTPTVAIMPLNFHYGVPGSAASWSSFGTWFLELNKGMDILPSSEKIVVNKLVEGISDEKEMIKKLYHYLQDKTKYVNVSIDLGGLKSYPASYVCQNKYGDCKALTTYMKAMLNHLSIGSFYTIINSGTNAAKINIDFPSPQFNHLILTVPLENDTIWLENTSNSAPLNYLSTFTQNRYALMVKNTGSKLIQMPKLKPADVIEKRKFDFTVDDSGIWQVSIYKELRGYNFEKYRSIKTQKSLEEQKETVLDEISIEDLEITEWDIINQNRDSNNIDILVKGHCATPIRELGSMRMLSPLKIKIPEFEEPQKRKLPIRINYPVNKADSIIYSLPNLNDKRLQLPKNKQIVTKYGQYMVTYEVVKNKLVVNEHFLLNSGEYPIAEYPLFYSFMSEINDYKTKSSIILE